MQKMAIPKFLAALTLVGFAGAAQEPPIVTITGGKIRGSALSRGAVFKAIPFCCTPDR
jgi:hypothetical protein